MLTDEETAFLSRHKLGPEDVFDASGMKKATASEIAKKQNKALILGTPCKAAGHRLRTRSAGHCVQCDPSKLAYSNRHNEAGILYLAISESDGYLKIGSTRDVDDRERQLRASGYGARRDWRIVATAKVDKMGASERYATQQLDQWRVGAIYERAGKAQEASEMFKAPIRDAMTAFASAASAHHGSDFWKDDAALARLVRKPKPSV